MHRLNHDRDTVSQKSQGPKSPHTYTPGSHENLLRSHLQLDNERQARLQNDVKRLAQENDSLRRDFDDALRENQKKDDEINSLRNDLRNRPRSDPSRSQEPSGVYQLDGKPVNHEGVINHFNVIIKRHHDLLLRKNQEIRDLQDALDEANKRPLVKEPSRPNHEDFQELLNEIAKVRKEYEQSNYVLSERNHKLERLIDDLERKLDEYSKEIQHLRNQLAKPVQPSPSTLELIRKKEEENERLRKLIKEFQDKNLKLDNIQDEIKHIISSKEHGVNKINDIIYEMKNQPATTKMHAPDTSDIQKECQKAICDLNETKEKLNDLLERLRKLPEEYPTPGESPKKDLVPNLESIRNQCEDQILTLKKLLQPPVEYRTYTVQTQSYVKQYPTTEYVDDPPSRVNFPPEKEKYQYCPVKSPQISEWLVPEKAYTEPPRKQHYPTETCEACSEYLLTRPPTPVMSPRVSCEREAPRKKLISDDFYPPSQRKLEREHSKSKERERKLSNPKEPERDVPTRDKAKKPQKGGCCKKKPSETSNKYEKKDGNRKEDRSRRGSNGRQSRSSEPHVNRGKETVEKIHSPNRENEARQPRPVSGNRQPIELSRSHLR